MQDERPRRRIFVALALDEEGRELAVATIERLRRSVADARALRFVPPADLHVTLAFLGDLDEAGLASVRNVVARVAADHARMVVAMGGLGAFPRTSEARVVWLAFGRDDAPLARLVSDLDARLRAAGHHALEDREWTGHVTLARVRGRRGIDARPLLDGATGRQADCRVDGVAVMESRPTSKTSRYATNFFVDLSK
ncbi:MAG: RNA 2',3'-cyclic phosphodiesterase [Myxococcota bacterium]